MAGLISVFAAVTLSFILTRIGAVALVLTGMSHQSARFQARSAFLGVGFTTSEAESVTGHPVRRRVVMWLMWLGNAGVVTVVASLIISLGNDGASGRRLAILVAGLLLIALLARSKWLDRAMSGLIERALRRWTDLDVRDYAGLLHLAEGYTVAELSIQEGDWLSGRTLGELGLRSEGVVVLAVGRADGSYEAAPHGDTRLEHGDLLLVYGREARLAELDDRPGGPRGDAAHDEAVAEFREAAPAGAA